MYNIYINICVANNNLIIADMVGADMHVCERPSPVQARKGPDAQESGSQTIGFLSFCRCGVVVDA